MKTLGKYRKLPSIDSVLSEKIIDELMELYDRKLVVNLIRKNISEHREKIGAGGNIPSAAEVAATVATSARSEWHMSPQTVFNATGVILHTNLGRAPLAYSQPAKSTNLEFDLDTGTRGSRNHHAANLICRLT